MKKKTTVHESFDQELCVLADIDENSSVIVEEAELHDINCWPHRYPEKEIARMFPLAVAAEEVEAASKEERQEHRDLHQRWATLKIAVTRG